MFPSFGQSEIRLTTRTPKKETKMWSLADQCVRIAQHIEHVLNMNTTLLASHRQPWHRLSLVFDSYLEGLAALANHRILGDLPICPDTIHINSRKSRGQGRARCENQWAPKSLAWTGPTDPRNLQIPPPQGEMRTCGMQNFCLPLAFQVVQIHPSSVLVTFRTVSCHCSHPINCDCVVSTSKFIWFLCSRMLSPTFLPTYPRSPFQFSGLFWAKGHLKPGGMWKWNWEWTCWDPAFHEILRYLMHSICM